MAESRFITRLKQGPILLDGAMGTELAARGASAGVCNDMLNIESPELVADVHKAYVQAGCDAVTTNTFGACKIALARHGHGDKVKDVNLAAAKIAREAVGPDRLVLGDIGPCGEMLAPLGTLQPDQLQQAYQEQAEALIEGGVDAIIVETMTSLEEIIAAVQGVKAVSKDIPILATLAYNPAGEDDFKTMMGVSVEQAISEIIPLGVAGVGFNCGKMSLKDYVRLASTIIEIIDSLDANVALIAQPNAGLPELVAGKAIFKVTAPEFADAIERIIMAGVTVVGGCCGTVAVGGCCGTNPGHIQAVAEKMKELK